MALSINPAVSRTLTRFSADAAVFFAGTVIGSALAVSLAWTTLGLIRVATSEHVAIAAAILVIALAAARELGAAVPLPYRRQQVPERWRGTMPTWAFSFLYGLLLGFGFVSPFTYSTHLAMLAGVPFVGSLTSLTLAIGLFAIGKSLSLFTTLSRDGDGASSVHSGITRFGRFTLHVVTVATSGLVVVGLCARYLV